MKFRLLSFFLLLVSSAFGQSSTFHSLISEGRLPLDLGDVVTFPLAEARAQGAINMLVSPTCLYDSGKTHVVWQNPEDCSMNIFTYDERYGASRPIRYRRKFIDGECDSHHRPTIISDNDTLYITTEVQHNEEPLVVFQARQPNDELTFEVTSPVTEIGSGPSPDYPAYPTIYKNKDGYFINFAQVNDIDAAYNKNTSGHYLGTANWSANTVMMTRAGTEDEIYQAAIMNKRTLVDDFIPFVPVGRNDDLQPARWFRKYLVKINITPSGQTYSNWDGSFTKTSQLTASEANLNFKYYDLTDSAQGYIPTPSMDDEGNFYDVTGTGAAGGNTYEFIYWPVGEAAPIIKAISLPGSPDLQTYWEAGGSQANGQNGANVMTLAINKGEIYAFFRILTGGFNKIYQYVTHDLGDTWEEIGDTLPGVNAHIGSLLMPYNFGEIENNRNFILTFIEVKNATRAGIWVRKAAFGTVQTDDGNPYDDVTAYTESEYDALMARSYYVEAGKVTNSGTTLTTLIDQSASAQDATQSGNPVLDNGTTPTEVTLDGVNDRIIVPITGLTTASEGMIIAVADMVDATNGNFVTASDNGTTVDYLLFGKSSGDVIRFSDSNVALISGQTDVTDAYHIFVFLFQNGDGVADSQTDVLQFLDGSLQQRVITSGDVVEGGFLNTVGDGLTHISIGALVRTTTAFYNCKIKHVAISTEPFSYEQLRRSLKYLGTKYSITLVSGYQ